MESVQLTLVSAGSLDKQSKFIGHKLPIEVGPGSELDGPPVGLNVTIGGRVLELAYAAHVAHVANFARMVSEPWPRPQAPVSHPSSKSFLWKSASNGALVKEFELSVFATLDGNKLTIEHVESSTSGTQRLQLKFLDGTKEMGELTMTAVMDALPTF